MKTRVEALDYWSHVYAAFAAWAVGTFALGAIIGSEVELLGYGLAVASVTIGTCLGRNKFQIDRRKLWYKYVLCHLEGIKGQAR